MILLMVVESMSVNEYRKISNIFAHYIRALTNHS